MMFFRQGSSRTTALWILLLKIELLELELQCVVLVIHVPGTIMIEQGMDNRSRVVDMQSLGVTASSLYYGELPRPLRPCYSGSYPSFHHVTPPNASWIFQTDMGDWTKTPMVNQCVLWCPSPTFPDKYFSKLCRYG